MLSIFTKLAGDNLLSLKKKCHFFIFSFLFLIFSKSYAQNSIITLTAPKDLTLSCSDIIPQIKPAAKSTCEVQGSLVFSFTDVVQGECTKTITRTWIVADACGTKNSIKQTITIIDNKPPVMIGIPSNVTVSCASIPSPITPTAKDACGGAVTVTFKETKLIGRCSYDYKIKREYIATDKCGNSVVKVQMVTVTDKIAPTFLTKVDNITISCSNISAATPPTVKDNCSSLAEIVIVKNDLKIQGNCADNYTIRRTWTAIDKCGNRNSLVQMITVRDSELPTLQNLPSNVTLECKAKLPLVGGVTGKDNCDLSVAIVFKETKKEGTCPSAYTLYREWTASDNCFNKKTGTQIITIKDTKIPTFNEILADLTVSCDSVQLITIPTVTAKDNCDAAPKVYNSLATEALGCKTLMTYTFSAVDACGNTAILKHKITIEDKVAPVFETYPEDLTLDCDISPTLPIIIAKDNCDANAIIKMTEDIVQDNLNPCERKLVRTWTASDKCVNTSTVSQTIYLVDNKVPTFVSVPANTTIECGTFADIKKPVAIDNCTQNVAITHSDTLYYQDSCQHKVLRKWRAEDLCGNFNEVTQTIITIDTKAPEANFTPLDVTVSCQDTIPAVPDLKFTDACAAKLKITFNEYQSGNSLQLTPYWIERVWSAIDDCGNEKKIIQRIKVTRFDTQPPKFETTNLSKELFLECETPNIDSILYYPAYPKATNICDTAVVVTFNDEKTFELCSENAYILERIWTATDDAGNTATFIQFIYVQDHTPPMIFNIPDDLTLTCGEELPDLPEDIIAIDFCALNGRVDTLAVSFDETNVAGGCDGIGQIIRRWKTLDSCNNETILEQIITYDTMTVIAKNGQKITKNVQSNAILKEKKTIEKLKVYPNPNSGLLFVQLPPNTEQVSIVNELGQVLYQNKNLTDRTLRLDLQTWQNGIYFIHSFGENQNQVERLILQRK